MGVGEINLPVCKESDSSCSLSSIGNPKKLGCAVDIFNSPGSIYMFLYIHTYVCIERIKHYIIYMYNYILYIVLIFYWRDRLALFGTNIFSC